ncbi:MAG: ATP-dependent zinc metalloprotease FtsH [Clostridia bacterium]|nr:ATP-dependent zinc metalloprotease FtsH [Clostridia bacterium]
MKKKNTGLIIFYLLLIGVIFLLVNGFARNASEDKYGDYSEIVKDFNTENVQSFKISENGKITVVRKDGSTKSYKLLDFSIFYADLGDTIRDQLERGVIEKYDYQEPSGMSAWLSLLPTVLLIVVFVLVWVFVLSGARGSKINNFGKAHAKMGSDEKKRVLFKDVAGADEEKDELVEIVDFLRSPSKYTKLGAKIPHGVLLVGPPGTGKTLLAKAVAGEAGVPFFSISGSDFVEMYVGVGASRVRSLFEEAKKHPVAIVFIDEIDAVGRHRGAGLGGGHDEREQTLNQLLVEMDGFGSGNAVIVMAATNRPDILDPALLRPGRFDRTVTVSYPDIKGRLEILKIHAQGKPFENSADLEKVAKATVGFTGADLANLLNEAALLAARRGKLLIGEDELEDASIKVIVGTQKKSRVVKEKEKKLTAYHEAGHAILTKLLQPENQVHQISIIPTGMAGGYTIHRPNEDTSYSSKNDMKNEIVVLLGGRMAEKLIMDDISTGASHDIQQATEIAKKMVTKYGMSDLLGPLVYGSQHGRDEIFLGRDINSQRDYSENTADQIDSEVKRIVLEAYELAEHLLTENMDKLHFIADFLMKNEVMDEYQFEAVMSGTAADVSELEAIRDEHKRQSAQENEDKARREADERRAREEEERRRLDELLGRIDPNYRPQGDGNNGGNNGDTNPPDEGNNP